jgi:hypothetical protein
MTTQPIGECIGYCNDIGPLYDDMKKPPMDTEECLCRDCAQAHAEEAIEELDDQIHDIQNFIKEKLK